MIVQYFAIDSVLELCLSTLAPSTCAVCQGLPSEDQSDQKILSEVVSTSNTEIVGLQPRYLTSSIDSKKLFSLCARIPDSMEFYMATPNTGSLLHHPFVR